jgi:predicted NAD/FAD-dependent oxidoreductase
MRAIIFGAGIAGLTYVRVLREGDAEVAVFEASDGVGGRLRTDALDTSVLSWVKAAREVLG